MKEIKTKKNDKDVLDYLNSIEPLEKREDSLTILRLMEEVIKEEPKMWGDSMIGFGEYTYTGSNKVENKWFKVGFAPRKQALTLYLMYGFEEHKNIMDRLGKYKTGKACLYIKNLTDINIEVLRELIVEAYKSTT